jgi:eukaryotic-like serine/threonine-protein kinase
VDLATERDSRRESTRIAREVDEACDRFEAAWRSGDRPSIEDFYGGATDVDCPGLFQHLLELELDYRRRLGESPGPSEYRRRFPGRERLINSIFVKFVEQSQLVPSPDSDTRARTAVDHPTTGSPQGLPDFLLNIPGIEVLSELGRGGMGVVYMARQIRLNRLCAVKVALPGRQNSAEFRARFLAEAETIARLKHANIVQIYDLGEHDGRPYFEMEYIEGGSLARRLNGTPWLPESAARTVSLLARAIGEAHRLGIVHRDLKPANVLLVDDNTPKVVDFGLAKLLEADSNLTQSGVFVGTPSYAAPEQVEGSPTAVGPPADIYALGAIFYHMLTGRPPFQAATALQTLEQVKTADPVPPSRLQPGLPRDVETICLKCLQKDPHRRYDNAAALGEDLDRYLAGMPILARPTGAVDHFRKWIKRRPAVAMLSSALALVTVLGFTAVSWQWRRAEAKADAEVAANLRAQEARLRALENQAELTFNQALALCDQGEVGRGLLWLGRSLELASEARSERLERPIRINLADWASQLSRPLRRGGVRHSRANMDRTSKVAGRELHRDMPVELSVLTPAGRRVITARHGGRIHIWDTEMERGFDLPPQGTEVTCLAVSPDGRILASATEGGVVRVWDTVLLGQIGQTCKLAGAATALAFEPDGRVLAVEGDDGAERLWELPHQKAIGSPVRVNHPVRSLTLAADGRQLLIGTNHGAQRWDLTGQMSRESNHCRDHRAKGEPSSRVEATVQSPDGLTVATARSETAGGRTRGRVELRESATSKSLGQTPDHPHALKGVVYSPDSKRLLTWGSKPGTTELWDITSLRESRPICQSLTSPIRQATFSGDGRILLLGCRDGKARLWDVAKDVEIDPEHRPRHAYPITAVAFDPKRSRVVTGCHAGTVRVWDTSRRALLKELRQNAGEIVALAFSPDAKLLLTASDDGTARFVDAESGAQLGPALHHSDAVLCVAFDPNGKTVLTGARDGIVQRWSVPSPPHTGAAARIRQWLEEQTGMQLDDQGSVTMCSVCN